MAKTYAASVLPRIVDSKLLSCLESTDWPMSALPPKQTLLEHLAMSALAKGGHRPSS